MLTIIRGLPGSGKSTIAKEKYPFSLLLENDMFHVHNLVYGFDASNQKQAVRLVKDIAKRVLESGADVVIANVLPTVRQVDELINLAIEADQEYEVVRVVGNHQSVHGVPPMVLKSMAESFEPCNGEIIFNNYTNN